MSSANIYWLAKRVALRRLCYEITKKITGVAAGGGARN